MPLHAYPDIIEFQETQSLTGISSNNWRATFKSPHFPYINTKALRTNKFSSKPAFTMDS
ncbi:hypothetical protein HanIR_Chr03g0134291 [Helianthus annuus]|nr:hypothetical protein HanIR_Chr03g0134291 [Helianthus annuus]